MSTYEEAAWLARTELENEYMNADGIELLRKAARQFRYYEQNHREKAEGYSKLAAGEKMAADSIAKAGVNAAHAEEIEIYLGRLARDGQA